MVRRNLIITGKYVVRQLRMIVTIKRVHCYYMVATCMTITGTYASKYNSIIYTMLGHSTIYIYKIILLYTMAERYGYLARYTCTCILL